MNAVVISFVALVAFAAVHGERCTGSDITTCSHLTCDSSSVKYCANGVCTCAERGPEGSACKVKQDCLNVNNWNCPHDQRHCVDAHCHCGN